MPGAVEVVLDIFASVFALWFIVVSSIICCSAIDDFMDRRVRRKKGEKEMLQGSIGLFENKLTREYRWLWSVRDRDTKAQFYIDMETGEHVSDDAAQEFKKDGLFDGWSLVRELAPDEAFACITFDAPDISSMIQKESARMIAQRIEELEEARDTAFESWDETSKKANALYKYYQQIRNAILDAQNALLHQDDNSTFCYVYAKYSASDTKDWCWYAGPDIANTIHVGDVILVDTVTGAQNVFVTRIEFASDYRPHKQVIMNMTEHKEE